MGLLLVFIAGTYPDTKAARPLEVLTLLKSSALLEVHPTTWVFKAKTRHCNPASLPSSVTHRVTDIAEINAIGRGAFTQC